jgi:calcineurin-like phosphoesterase
MKVLMIGDVVGEAGLRALEAGLPALLARRGAARHGAAHDADFVVVNGENAAEGYGLTASCLDRMLAAGADIVTGGNHIWEKQEFLSVMDRFTAYGARIMKGEAAAASLPDRTAQTPTVLRPANYPLPAPGTGAALLEKKGRRLLVINVQGREYMTAIDCPFRTAASILEANPGVPAVIDFHAESSAEKEAFGLYLDGRAAAIAGTHTHVQTADAKILPRGTAYITDLGMTGPVNGVIGMDAEICLARAKTQVLYRMQCAQGPCAIEGAVIEIDERKNGGFRAASIINLRFAVGEPSEGR